MIPFLYQGVDPLLLSSIVNHCMFSAISYHLKPHNNILNLLYLVFDVIII